MESEDNRLQTPASLTASTEKSSFQVVRGAMHSADFYPEDDNGEPLDGMLITIRVPVTTVVVAGSVIVQFLGSPVDFSDDDASKERV